MFIQNIMPRGVLNLLSYKSNIMKWSEKHAAILCWAIVDTYLLNSNYRTEQLLTSSSHLWKTSWRSKIPPTIRRFCFSSFSFLAGNLKSDRLDLSFYLFLSLYFRARRRSSSSISPRPGMHAFLLVAVQVCLRSLLRGVSMRNWNTGGLSVPGQNKNNKILFGSI